MLGTEEKETILYHANVVNVSAAVVIKKQDKFLMIQEQKPGLEGKWNWPSGKAHLNENIFEAAEREAKEETGLDIKVSEFISTYYYRTRGNSNDGKLDRITIRFNFWGQVTKDAKLHTDAKWKTPEEIKTMFQEKMFRNWIARKLTLEALQDIKYPLETVSLGDR